MRRAALFLILSGLIVAALMRPPLARQLQAETEAATLQPAQSKPEAQPAPLKLKVGDTAPDFKLLAFDGQDVKPVALQDFRGKKNVALAFYVFAFTGGWTKEMRAFQENLSRLEAANTQVLGVSVDSPFANFQFAQENGISFPLLSDMNAKVIEEYGLKKDVDIKGVPVTTARRATFLIDKEGKILEMSVDSEALDPAKIVLACERRKKG